MSMADTELFLSLLYQPKLLFPPDSYVSLLYPL